MSIKTVLFAKPISKYLVLINNEMENKSEISWQRVLIIAKQIFTYFS